jgi:GT2 family glycosyltransferase
MEETGPQTPLSVVVPVHDGAGTLPAVLGPLLGELGPADELIVVDDRSSDGSADMAGAMGVRVMESSGRPGAAGARNTGGMAAAGDWVLFVDSDAVVPSGWRIMLEGRIGSSPDAVQAVYAGEAAGGNPSTFYKNFYYHYTFTRRIRGDHISGCGTFFFAVRRDRFADLGGFDDRIRGATVEDSDFAERLTGAGGRILIAREIEVFHLRRYTLPELLRYEWRMMRAKALYLLRRNRSHGSPSISVASPGEMLPVTAGAAAVWGIPAGAAAMLLGAGWGVWVLLAGLAVVAAGHAGFWTACVRRGGVLGAKALLITFPDLLLVAPAVLYSLIASASGRRY